MTDFTVDLTIFPKFLHRLVRYWYLWQGVYLRAQGRWPGDDQREPRGRETHEDVFWGRRPPEMVNDNELALIDVGGISYYLTLNNACYLIDSKERGSRKTYWMFRKFEDVEKYLAFLISQMCRPGRYDQSPAFRWYQAGLHPRVTLSKPDPENYPGRVSLTVDHEPVDRGWMGQHDAIAGSHVLVKSFEELDSALREGVPTDWFTVNILSD